ncbi:DNAJ protein JJJ1 homolog [Rosa rugosa]|uniref:DNAJ protein JJJ1 homolog n=1 Tax=Rosa rugosa TaxID=74645 RepID=UPI002B40C5F8|nr:DNAJ protein JJJ1 homolog [Rosa rugosa]XP_062027210.1 DNAJ protein JJJ1 homolog [Rosa rugosa]XP_062027211.1 DNAJ protein JJJ1 homolog [Rosa rugosa]XP_062027212.1 DNAJ protein JJJ1 homolog [Rosa rugosa]XP_062027213.1 DNAJ protein JJJ1 homolog [Rosa rugosa]XP_062027214.1 DNAJ protein JJJ1 homolog [Rosa rugosa]XP_062027215.1 DNAJ protein JJJ1 homolog [Rosa rugosa]
MVKSTERVCHYETLGLEPNCSEKEIKAAHRKLILTYHWDKCRSSQCGLSQEEATAKFLEVQQAYEILMDPIKRETYNAYRQTYAVPEVFNPDLEVPFDDIVFNGYSSSCRSFYNVYSDIFQRIYANERAFQKKNDLPWNSVHKPPDMGNLDTPYPEVVQFYNYWLNFSSIMDFCWEDPHDEYDLSQISRRGVKEWSSINMKARKKAKKEYNNKVRSLTQTAKRLDRRVMQMVAKREEERKREIEEERERRKRLKKEKLVKAMEYEEQEWTKPVERKRKYSNKEEEEEEKERDEWECVVCRKVFRSERQCRNHEQSKKHLRMVAKLMELLEVLEEKPDEEEVLEEAKRNEVVGGSDSEEEFVDGVNDNQREKLSETGEVDDEEVEEDEMGVLEAMVARRKTMEEVGEDILESILVEPTATSSQEVNNADEVAMEHDKLKKTNKNGEDRKPRRRRAKSTRNNEHDGSNMKESKPDCNAEKGYDEDQIKKMKGGGRKERSGKKSNGKGDIEQKKMRSGGRREEKKAKNRNGGERRINEHGTSYFSAVNESYLNMLHLIFI